MRAPSEERIATLEAQQEYMSREIAEMREDLRAIRKDVAELADNDRKRSSFVLGIVFTVSTIWALIGGLWAFVRHKFGA